MNTKSCFLTRRVLLALIGLSLLGVPSNLFAAAPEGAAPAEAKNNDRAQLARLGRNNGEILQLFEPVVGDLNESVVRFEINGKQTSLGVIVDPRGYIITKASLITENVQCLLQDGSTKEYERIATSAEHDLVLLKIEHEGLSAIAIGEENLTDRGYWVIAAGTDDRPIAAGIVSVGPRVIGAPGQPRRMLPQLGFSIKQKEGQIFIQDIYPHTASTGSSLRTGDIIVEVNATTISTLEQINNILEELELGEQITLTYEREGEQEEEQLTLTEMLPFGFDKMKRGLSGRRSGFPMALQHDGLLAPNQCGGPLLDLNGEVIGINIARFNRIGSLAIPASDVRTLLEDWLPEE